MKLWLRRGALICSCLGLMSFAPASADRPQEPVPPGASRDAPEDIRLPNGKMQRDEILKAEHEQNIKDAAKLEELVQDLRESLEKEDRFVFSLSTVKKTEDIEKLAHKIRTRMRHD